MGNLIFQTRSRSKNDALPTVDFEMCRECGTRVRTFRLDNGKKFIDVHSPPLGGKSCIGSLSEVVTDETEAPR